ncbi:lactococcin 972 family bacteriocin [Sinomonas sp. ASV322]|uniref:lactococcin 972 family bacteriocin n=1 Tax=Sinomonas sp. ASV322 TaxID=3041920 RepID=UPI0027DC9ACE|nr:lactococcin 972 family bacteriocin [Sinomonas sp. ASV322]MDQ4503850.1 lactococcin 972 family bacteriocin [Sinomonas sp. ASV322]
MKAKKVMAGLALTGLLTTTGAAAANAWTQYPNEGGTWNYGYNGGIYSDYLVDRCHGSTVVNDWGTQRTAETWPGRWSNAWHTATIWTNNRWYYWVCG